jgi:hypothetical protein
LTGSGARRRASAWPLLLVVVALSAIVSTPLEAAADGTTATVVAVTQTSTWFRPSPDPSGLTYMRGADRLVVTDAEVEEMPLWRGRNVWFTGLDGWPTGGWSTTRWTREPSGIAVMGRRTLYVTDDDRDTLYRIRRGPDERWGTADDRVSRISTVDFGSRDPEGVCIGAGSIFVIDGTGHTVFRLTRGANGRFDGAPPAGDDQVTSFDTLGLGLRDPEGGYYDASARELYLISRKDLVIVRATPSGDLIESIDISDSGILRPADIALAPGSADASVTHVYIVDRGVDNNTDPRENDGRLFEFELS